jgi:hypothetical protein
MRRALAVLILVPASLAVAARAAQKAQPAVESPGKGALSPRVVAYQIEARLDPVRKTLDATEVLTYRNLTGQPLDRFPFHLYLNGFQPQSSFVAEIRRDNPAYEWKEKYRGAITIKSFEVIGVGDFTSQLRFIQPDDGNRQDHTVAEVKLPRPVPPGDEVQFKIVFHDQFPEVLARTGYKRDFFMGGQWFPKVGVWWHGAWNCHQFHAMTEFFADFGVYDVQLTVPQNYVVGATGVEVASLNHPDGTKTVGFHAEDVHDFAWTADPNYLVVEDTWTGSAGPVKIRLFMHPGHMATTPRYLQALKGALERFDQWYGPYPYPQITVVDPPHGGLRAGGMEYPTLFTADTTWWMPLGLKFPEVAVVHEFGHQYWYGMVATNEFEEAWLDEGINTYVEVKIMRSLYGNHAVDLWGLTGGDAGLERLDYLSSAQDDPLARVGFHYMSRGTYGAITYGKTATVLLTLEGLIGEDSLRRSLRTYFLRYRFTHPTGEDFLHTVEEVSGQNLRWFFDQAVYGTQVLDYEVLDLNSDPLDWWEAGKMGKEEPGKKDDTVYRSSVLIHRKGDFIFPVEVEVRFDNGEKVREHWDGRDRWVRFTYEKKAKLVSAEVDPDHNVWLDRDFFNNSRTVEPLPGARRKLYGYWLLFAQFLAQFLSWWL